MLDLEYSLTQHRWINYTYQSEMFDCAKKMNLFSTTWYLLCSHSPDGWGKVADLILMTICKRAPNGSLCRPLTGTTEIHILSPYSNSDPTVQHSGTLTATPFGHQKTKIKSLREDSNLHSRKRSFPLSRETQNS